MRPYPLREVGQHPTRPGAGIERRSLMQKLSAAAMLAVAAPVRAATPGAELVFACDLTLGPAMHAAAKVYTDMTGERVNVFPTAPGLIVPQLEREVQNDVLLTRAATMEAAVQAGIVAKDAARGAWHNRLIVAAKRGAPATSDKPIAVTDASPVSDMDGPAILARLGLLPAPTLGVIDTDEVAALVIAGTARAGLLHMTDLRAHPELEAITVVSDDVEPPFIYAVAVTKLARRPSPAGFVEFLMTSQSTALLASLGLETSSS